jgi:hypothetical protein
LLPELDRDFLDAKGYDFEVHRENDTVLLVIRNMAFPAAYQPQVAELLIIIPAGYPNAQLDMFWTFPDVKLANGGWPAQSEHHQAYLGKNWQRWSRHFQQPWRPGIDSLKTFVASVRSEINKGI